LTVSVFHMHGPDRLGVTSSRAGC